MISMGVYLFENGIDHRLFHRLYTTVDFFLGLNYYIHTHAASKYVFVLDNI